MWVFNLVGAIGSLLAGAASSRRSPSSVWSTSRPVPEPTPRRTSPAGHDRLRQQRLTRRPASSRSPTDSRLLGVLAVDAPAAQHLADHHGERLLRVPPGEGVAHLARALGQLRPHAGSREQPRGARRSKLAVVVDQQPGDAVARSTRACRRRRGRRRSGSRACRPRRPPGPSPPSARAGPAPRPARRSRACAARRRGPRRRRCRRRRALRRTRAASPSHQPLPTTTQPQVGELGAQGERPRRWRARPACAGPAGRPRTIVGVGGLAASTRDAGSVPLWTTAIARPGTPS